MIKAVVTLAVFGGLLAGALPTAAVFAERQAEYQATVTGLVVARNAHLAAPTDAQLERTYDSLIRHCVNLATAYNVGYNADPDSFDDAGLPSSLDLSACN